MSMVVFLFEPNHNWRFLILVLKQKIRCRITAVKAFGVGGGGGEEQFQSTKLVYAHLAHSIVEL